MHGVNNEPPYFIEEAVEVLQENLPEIKNVSAWARFMGFSRSYFCTQFKNYFEIPPAQKLRNVRYERLQNVIANHPNEISMSIAQRCGLQNEQALYKFLSFHYNTNFTEFRNKVLRENR